MKSDTQGPPKAHILLVEDDPAVRAGLREYLSASGFEVSEADSCAAAQSLFQTVRIDTSIMDYRLPDGNAATPAHGARSSRAAHVRAR